MIVTEFYRTREDGINLYITYSNLNRYIIQNETGAIYAQAIDVEGIGYTYSETDDEIETPEEENDELQEEIIQPENFDE